MFGLLGSILGTVGQVAGFIARVGNELIDAFKSLDNHKSSHTPGGWGATAFANIINAHSSADEIVEEFALYEEDCPYNGGRPYRQAYQEIKSELGPMAEMLGVDVDELIDEAEVEDLAYDYALEEAEEYIDGTRWIPFDIIQWAFYDVSDHNG